MGISKKVRFEVFKRDGFVCQYCGQHPPAVVLEVDHIRPKAKNGTDEIDNLVTSCFDCNRGKKDIPLTELSPTLETKHERLQEKQDQLKEYERLISRNRKKIMNDCQKVVNVYEELNPGNTFTDRFINVSIKLFVEKLGVHEVIDSLYLAEAKTVYDREQTIRYFCGICWAKIRGEKVTT